MKFEIIDKSTNNNSFLYLLLKNDNLCLGVIKNQETDQLIKELYKYKNLSIDSWFTNIEGIERELIILNTSLSEDFFALFKGKDSHQMEESIKTMSTILKKYTEISYKKFRGDYAELLFILERGAIKNHDDSLSWDVMLNGGSVEIKSYSERSWTINVSDLQFKQNIPIYCVPLVPTADGKNILELADELGYENSRFKNYITEVYSDSEYRNIKFERKPSHEYHKNTDLNTNFPKEIVSAEFKIYIKP